MLMTERVVYKSVKYIFSQRLMVKSRM